MLILSVSVRIHLSSDSSHQLTSPGADFLSPQPAFPARPDIFLLRYILHDQSDKYATILLRHLRDAAKDTTKLIIIDFVVDYACPIPEGLEYSIPGDPAPVAPPPLLPNFGVAGAQPYDMDMVVRYAYSLLLQGLSSLIDA